MTYAGTNSFMAVEKSNEILEMKGNLEGLVGVGGSRHCPPFLLVQYKEGLRALGDQVWGDSKIGSSSESEGSWSSMKCWPFRFQAGGSGTFLSLPGGKGASLWAKDKRKNTHVVTDGSGTLGEEQRSSDFLVQWLKGGAWGKGVLPCLSEEKVKLYLRSLHCPGYTLEQELAETWQRGSGEGYGVSTGSKHYLSDTSQQPVVFLEARGKALPVVQRVGYFELGPSP